MLIETFHLKAGLHAVQGRRFMKTNKSKWLIVITALSVAGWMTGAQSAQRPAEAYALAAELPRGALLYAQFSDWPEAVRDRKSVV